MPKSGRSTRSWLQLLQPASAVRAKPGRPKGSTKRTRWTDGADVLLCGEMRRILQRDPASNVRRAANKLLANGFVMLWQSETGWRRSAVADLARYRPATRVALERAAPFHASRRGDHGETLRDRYNKKLRRRYAQDRVFRNRVDNLMLMAEAGVPDASATVSIRTDVSTERLLKLFPNARVRRIVP